MMDALPNLQSFEAKMKVYVDACFADQQEKQDLVYRQLDNRLVSLRKDFDIDLLLKRIADKADSETVNNDLKNHEFKISLLDKNLIHMATDFQVVQTALGQVNSQILELQEVNKDVLVGKKRLNCLSCGTMPERQEQMIGSDGQMYRIESDQ